MEIIALVKNGNGYKEMSKLDIMDHILSNPIDSMCAIIWDNLTEQLQYKNLILGKDSHLVDTTEEDFKQLVKELMITKSVFNIAIDLESKLNEELPTGVFLDGTPIEAKVIYYMLFRLYSLGVKHEYLYHPKSVENINMSFQIVLSKLPEIQYTKISRKDYYLGFQQQFVF